MADDNKHAFVMLAIVAIVAIVGMVVMMVPARVATGVAASAAGTGVNVAGQGGLEPTFSTDYGATSTQMVPIFDENGQLVELEDLLQMVPIFDENGLVLTPEEGARALAGGCTDEELEEYIRWREGDY